MQLFTKHKTLWFRLCIVLVFSSELYGGQVQDNYHYAIKTTDSVLNTDLAVPIQNKFQFSQKISKQQMLLIKALIDSLPTELKPFDIEFVLADRFSSSLTEKGKFLIAISSNEAIELQRSILKELVTFYEKTNHVSKSPAWQNISQWRATKFGRWHLEEHSYNADRRGFVSKEAMSNARNDFIESVVYYALPISSSHEESMKCRLPDKYEFIANRFKGWSSPLELSNINCGDFSTDFMSDLDFLNRYDQKIIKKQGFNANDVTGFELLYASPGAGDVAEIAGHLLLRIRFKQDANNVDGLNDIVVSFLANTEQEHLISAPIEQKQCKKNWFSLLEADDNFDAFRSIGQSLKGLSGLYLSSMERQSMAQALKNYTVEEDRNLLRYRLILSDDQKTSLLVHLNKTKKNFNARYYFFKQNCASILVKTIGLGIANKRIAHFDPMVSPPHTLVNLFISEGLAKPVFPSYLSYRQKGFLAKKSLIEIFSDHKGLTIKQAIFSRFERRRLKSAKDLFYLRSEKTENDTLYYMAQLIQESEMIHAHKDLVCRDYTSTVTEYVRSFQKDYLEKYGPPTTNQYDDSIVSFEKNQENKASSYTLTAKELTTQYGTVEAQDWSSGELFTGHNQFSIVLSEDYLEGGQSVFSYGFDYSAHHQSMGSASSLAMQRTSYVDFVRLRYLKNSFGSEFTYNFLKLRKFKQQLNSVEPIYDTYRQIGIGLSVLNGERSPGFSDMEIGRGEVLLNLFSGTNYNRYLYASAGLALNRTKLIATPTVDSIYTVNAPLALEGLWTFSAIKARGRWESYGLSSDDGLEKQRLEFSLRKYLKSKISPCGSSICSIGLNLERYQLKMESPLLNELIVFKRDRASLDMRINYW